MSDETKTPKPAPEPWNFTDHGPSHEAVIKAIEVAATLPKKWGDGRSQAAELGEMANIILRKAYGK